MTNPEPEFHPETAVSVGRIVAPHGVRGHVKVQPLTDFPQRFRRGSTLWLDAAPYRVEQSRWQGPLVYLKLAGIDDRSAAEAVRGHDLQVPRAFDLDEEVFYQHDVIGLEAVDTSGVSLGRVQEILSTGSNDVYVVRGERGELLLPAIEDVIKAIDLEHRRIEVELLPGLDFQKPSPRPTSKPRRRASRSS